MGLGILGAFVFSTWLRPGLSSNFRGLFCVEGKTWQYLSIQKFRSAHRHQLTMLVFRILLGYVPARLYVANYVIVAILPQGLPPLETHPP